MSAIALLVTPGKLVGFLLLANPAAFSEAPSESDCIFTGVPTDSSLLAHELCAFVQENKNTEYYCSVEKNGSDLVLKVTLNVDSVVLLTVRLDGTGKWYIERKGKRSIEGICELAAKKANPSV